MWIFEGVRWKGGVKLEWGRRKWRFSLLSLAISYEPSHLRPQLSYCAMQPLNGSSLAPKQMTLNDPEWSFWFKSVSVSASNGLAFWLSEKSVIKFADLSIHCILLAAKM